jgi:hypothetical protein
VLANPANALAEMGKTDFFCGIPAIPCPRENTDLYLLKKIGEPIFLNTGV